MPRFGSETPMHRAGAPYLNIHERVDNAMGSMDFFALTRAGITVKPKGGAQRQDQRMTTLRRAASSPVTECRLGASSMSARRYTSRLKATTWSSGYQ